MRSGVQAEAARGGGGQISTGLALGTGMGCLARTSAKLATGYPLADGGENPVKQPVSNALHPRHTPPEVDKLGGSAAVSPQAAGAG